MPNVLHGQAGAVHACILYIHTYILTFGSYMYVTVPGLLAVCLKIRHGHYCLLVAVIVIGVVVSLRLLKAAHD